MSCFVRGMVLFAVILFGCGDAVTMPVEATVTTIASGMMAPYGILVDNGSYLVTGGGNLYSIKGSEASIVKTLTAPSGSGLLRHKGSLFVLDNPPGKLLSIDSSWKSTEVATGLGNPVDLDIDGDALIVDDYDNRQGSPGGPSGNNGRILRVYQDGRVDVVASIGLGGVGAVSVQPDGYYVTDYDGGRLLRVSKDKGTVTVVATGLGNPVGIKWYGSAFYIADFAGASSAGRILQVGKDGSVKVLNASGLGSAAGLAIEGKDILITDLIGGRLLRVSGGLENP